MPSASWTIAHTSKLPIDVHAVPVTQILLCRMPSTWHKEAAACQLKLNVAIAKSFGHAPLSMVTLVKQMACGHIAGKQWLSITSLQQ